MTPDRKKNSQTLQIFVLVLILGGVGFSGFTLWKVNSLQSQANRHQTALSNLENIHELFKKSYEYQNDFHNYFLSLNYEMNESVNLGLITEAEANITIETALFEYRGKRMYDDAYIEGSFRYDRNITELEAVSPNVRELFALMPTYIWVSSDYEIELYLVFEFYELFNNTGSYLEAISIEFSYPHTKALIYEIFTQGYDPPYIIQGGESRWTVFNNYTRVHHQEPLGQINIQIQGFLLGNGINAIAIILLGLAADFKKGIGLKIVIFVSALGIMGWSILSLYLL